LSVRPGVDLEGFLTAAGRHTFTYTKPLVHRAGQPPEELSRLDLKNWSPTPAELRDALTAATTEAVSVSDAVIVLDQVDIAETGVVTPELLADLRRLQTDAPAKPFLADSRRGLRGWPKVVFKMNAKELGALAGAPVDSLDEIKRACGAMAATNGQPAFVTLAERGIVGAAPSGEIGHVPSLPVRGPIDIVGAGDSVTANLTAALAADATIREAMELAMAAASLVIHQLGTTGTASVAQLREVLF
jgi:bifunctional ADP-heptose synthase (sugar kinase/adenylyltransferase)